MKEVMLLLVFITLVWLTVAQDKCTGKPNTIPVITSPPHQIATAKNGALYQITEVQPPLNVLHVYGSPYEMGFAHGTLMKSMMQDLYPKFNEWVDGQVEQFISFLPKWLQDLVAKYGVEAALDATYLLTERYISQYFLDELKGMADGSGIAYMDIVRVHMFPELIKAHCTMVGAWGNAIKSTDGTLYQLRALDWSTDGPFQLYPTVIVYHPDNGHNFTIVTWAGFIGTISGFSSAGMGLSQKVWLAYNGTSSREGIPFYFLLRDILQFDANMDSAISRIANAHRTCSIFIGLGDNTNRFKAIEYSYERIEVYDDENFPVYEEHPRLEGAVYIDKHVQPSHNPCLGSLMQKYYGQLDALVMKEYIAALHETGNMHIAIYDYDKRFMYVANASPFVNNTYTPAYDRPFVRFDLNQLFTTAV